MKQIGTFRVKISSTFDRKKLSTGKTKDYKYGSVSIRSPELTEYIGKEVMIRIFEEEKEN
ncbi:MAG: hypothetical protein ACREBF_03605 [Candidatus Micrarchaeales archaeon]